MQGDLITAVVFYILAAVTVLAALGVVLRSHLIHAALLLAMSFIGVAGIYLMLSADFLAMVQLLIYGGAVAILIVFGVMLTQRQDMTETSPDNHWRPLGGLIAFGVLAVIVGSLLGTRWQTVFSALPESTTESLADLLLGPFMIPFEAAAVLLLVAMVGAVILAKGAKETP